jgi:hypothetical protein
MDKSSQRHSPVSMAAKKDTGIAPAMTNGIERSNIFQYPMLKFTTATKMSASIATMRTHLQIMIS